AFEDTSGNDFGGIIDKTLWNFTFGYGVDFGDAPAPYPVTMAENGARHQLGDGPSLGSNRDPEFAGVHSALSNLDDITGVPDDEDGVTFSTLRVGQLGAIATVQVQGAPDGARLDAWIDFNRDGLWGG